MADERVVAADSTSCLNYIHAAHNIEILPLYLHVGGRRLRDTIDINANQFVQWMINHPGQLPHSAPPDVEDVKELYKSWIKRGVKEAILITLSSGISETYAIAKRVAEQYSNDIKVAVFDSQTTLYGQAMLALEAEKLIQKGLPLPAIISQLDFMRSRSQAYFTVGELNYLIQNGRLSVAQGWLGQFLQVKPILHFNEQGQIAILEKVRKIQPAFERIIHHITEFVGNQPSNIYIMRSNTTAGEEFERQVKRTLAINNLISLPPSPVIACHTGPALFGIGAFMTLA